MKIFVTLFLFLLLLNVYAQQGNMFLSKKINLALDSANIEQLVTAIEKQTGCFFYYDASKADSFYISIRALDQSLETVLNKVFEDSGIFYFCDSQGHIFLTTNASISITMGVQPPAVVTKKQTTRAASKELILHHRTSIPTPDYLTPTRLTQEENKLFDIGIKTNSIGTGVATVAGYVRNYTTGEGISNASVVLEGTRTGTSTDQYGYFSFTMPKGKHTLKITCLGMADARRHIMLYSDGKITVNMVSYIASLKEVTVIGAKSSNVRSAMMGVQKINIKTARQLPALMGEVDIVRVLQMLPGVTTVGEGNTGLNVRGGAVDQNLVLYDGATIYNPSHFFGFFSGFNPDVVKDAELYKSSIPVRYASRLSSVLDVVTREGNRKKLSGSGGIGPLSGRFTLEGPIGKKTTFIAGIRSTYSNWLLQLLDDERYKQSRAGFYDGNLRISHELNDKNTFYFSAYISNDRFKLDGDTTYKYGNRNGIIKWKHNFNNRLTSTLTAGIDYYRFSMDRKNGNVNDFTFGFDVKQYHGKIDLKYAPNARHTFEGGISSIYYSLNPGNYQPIGKGLAVPNKVPVEQALEAALYFSDQYTITPDLSLNLGLRYNRFSYLGPHDEYQYGMSINRDVNNITDTLHKTGIIKTWSGLEPRIALRYSLSNNKSIKLAYNRTRQNIHMLSNTTAISPTDTWKLSDRYIQPQVGDQFSVGFYHNFKENTIETSLELYYKIIQHAITYKSGAILLLNHHIETDVVNASGKAYGAELLVKKTAGKLTGWISYTWSRTLLKMDDPSVISPTNGGNYFPADYDKPHVVNFVGNYRFSHRFSISLTTNYSTGRPITLPVARYYMGGSWRMLYADRNTYRIPDYFRTDFSMNIEGNHKIKKLAHSSWTLGVYNLTARRNPYSVYFVSEGGKVQGYKFSIFGTIMPFVTYNFKF